MQDPLGKRQFARSALNDDHEFATAVARHLAHQTRRRVRAVHNQKLRTGIERLANWVLATWIASGRNETFKRPVKKLVLASLLGLTPESLSRCSAQLMSHGASPGERGAKSKCSTWICSPVSRVLTCCSTNTHWRPSRTIQRPSPTDQYPRADGLDDARVVEINLLLRCNSQLDPAGVLLFCSVRVSPPSGSSQLRPPRKRGLS